MNIEPTDCFPDDDSGKQEWPGVMQLIEHCSQTDRPELREVGMQLIE